VSESPALVPFFLILCHSLLQFVHVLCELFFHAHFPQIFSIVVFLAFPLYLFLIILSFLFDDFARFDLAVAVALESLVFFVVLRVLRMGKSFFKLDCLVMQFFFALLKLLETVLSGTVHLVLVFFNSFLDL